MMDPASLTRTSSPSTQWSGSGWYHWSSVVRTSLWQSPILGRDLSSPS